MDTVVISLGATIERGGVRHFWFRPTSGRTERDRKRVDDVYRCITDQLRRSGNGRPRAGETA